MSSETDRQLSALIAGAVDVVSEDELRHRIENSLRVGKPLRVKFGADPSAPDIHLGHVVALNKLRQFQDFGHTVVFIIGDFTAMIGDPSGRSETRKPLSSQTIAENAKTYQKQVFKILDPKRTEVRFNSEWCAPLSLADVLKLSAHLTVARLLDRDDFKGRFENNQSITLTEFLYPLIQGYDSVAAASDVELGGTDQLFNLIVGRDLQRGFSMQPQAILTMPLLEGLDGVRKMSKSLGNYIGVDESAHDIFGKLMSISDELMWRYFELLLRWPNEQIENLRSRVEAGREHPRAVKDSLARELTAMFHGEPAAALASAEFSRVFSEGGQPDDIPTLSIPISERKNGKLWIVSLLVSAGLAESNGAARRLIQQGAVRVDEETVSDVSAELEIPDGCVVRVGKRGFVRITS